MERPFMKISELTEVGYIAGTIRGRIISRTGYKTYEKPGEPGKAEQMFTMILRDHTGEIKIVLFADIARQFWDTFELDHCYKIENFKIEHRITPYDNPFSVILTESTRVTVSTSNYIKKIPSNDFSSMLISKVFKLEDYDRVNIFGICVEAYEARQVSVKKSKRRAWKREIWLADESEACVKVTLWDYEAYDAAMTQNEFPIYFYNLRVNHYEGMLGLKSDMSSMRLVNPTGVPQERVQALMAWRENGGADQPLKTMQFM